jgi:hypothetical protein
MLIPVIPLALPARFVVTHPVQRFGSKPGLRCAAELFLLSGSLYRAQVAWVS